jgi:hypothetical protein
MPSASPPGRTIGPPGRTNAPDNPPDGPPDGPPEGPAAPAGPAAASIPPKARIPVVMRIAQLRRICAPYADVGTPPYKHMIERLSTIYTANMTKSTPAFCFTFAIKG